MNWIKRMNTALKYVESQLLENPDVKEVARIANSSEYHFQRLFYMLSGYTFGEYIRNRKLSLAAQDLLTKNEKIIDIAYKYGYETPESFSRAFLRLHGVSPRESRKEDVRLKIFPPLSFTLFVKGVTSMNFKIKSMESFTVAGKSIMVSTEGGKNLIDIPAFWQKCNRDGTAAELAKIAADNKHGVLNGSLASVLCYKETDTSENWSFLVGAETSEGISGRETVKIPPLKWAIFESVGPMPGAIQDVWKRIFSEWFPASNYEHDLGPELEVYPAQEASDSDPDFYCEVWIPVIEKT
jgi:AraC family transcriptional regulator